MDREVRPPVAYVSLGSAGGPGEVAVEAKGERPMVILGQGALTRADDGAIRVGLDDLATGTTVPLEEVVKEFEFRLPHDRDSGEGGSHPRPASPAYDSR